MTEWTIDCSGHNYVTLYYNGDFVRCYDNACRGEYSDCNSYYAENIINSIEKRTRRKITEIPIIGRVEDFDGLRFHTGFRNGSEWLNKSQEAMHEFQRANFNNYVAQKIYQLCVSKNYYTCGDNEQYESLLSGIQDGAYTKQQIATDICTHSDRHTDTLTVLSEVGEIFKNAKAACGIEDKPPTPKKTIAR